MDLNLSDEQKLIQQTARSFFTDRLPLSAVREMEAGNPIDAASAWAEITRLGWTAMTVPERAGGDSGSFLDQAILLEEFGRALAPLPYRATCVEATHLLNAADTTGAQNDLLRKIGAGEAIVVVAYEEAGGDSFPRSVATKAEREGDRFRITGRKVYVPYANLASHLIVAARLGDSSIGLFVVDASAPGVSISLIPEMSEDQSSYEAAFDSVEVTASAMVGRPPQSRSAIARMEQFSHVALCAEMVGAMDAVLRMTVDYGQNRVQFGRPIGSFSAVQSLCVDMLEYAEGSSHLVHECAWLLAEGRPAEKHIAMARGWVAEGLRVVAQNGHQVHGAIGFTTEHDMQLYSRRMLVAQGVLGGLRETADEVLELTA